MFVLFQRNQACASKGEEITQFISKRLVWAIAVFICIIFAIGVGSYSWGRYRMVPTVISVQDTHQPLYTFPFPTITVCSGTRVKRGPAREILSRYLPPEIPLKNKENIMLYVMSILSLLQFPNYNLMRPYLRTQEVKQMLHQFMDLNITDVMLQVMPECEEIFYECSWHGTKVNCCEVFLLQRTEEGFCWSFNSLTAEETSHCPLSDVLKTEGVLEEGDMTMPECQLRRNTGISAGSGLELFLRPSDPLDNIGYRAQRVVNGVSILIHTSYEFPQAGTGVYAPNMMGSQMSLAVAAEITTSSESIRSLDVEDRKCVFLDEERLHIHHVYTESTCLAECRMKYIMLMCRCKLYFFNLQDKFRFYRPPEGIPGVTDRELMDSLNCGCKPTCYDSLYDIHLQRDIPDNSSNQSRYAHVDIYYGKTGFVRYKRHIVFGFIDLIVSLGGVANLFLGFSLLSLVETIYWMYKILIVSMQTNSIQKTIIKVHPIVYEE